MLRVGVNAIPLLFAGFKPPVRNLLSVLAKVDYNHRVKFDPTRSFHTPLSKRKKYDPVELFALNGYLEQWNTGRHASLRARFPDKQKHSCCLHIYGMCTACSSHTLWHIRGVVLY